MNHEIEIDIGKCLRALWKRAGVISILTLLCGIIAVVILAGEKTELHSAQTTIYSATTESVEEAQQGVNILQGYASLVQSYRVCDRAALLLGIDGIDGEYIKENISVYTGMEQLTAANNIKPPIIYITAIGASPEHAMGIADAVAEAAVIEIKNITGNQSIQVLDKARETEVVYNSLMFTALASVAAMAAGFFLICSWIVLREICSPKLTKVRECALGDELEVMGVIPYYKS